MNKTYKFRGILQICFPEQLPDALPPRSMGDQEAGIAYMIASAYVIIQSVCTFS